MTALRHLTILKAIADETRLNIVLYCASERRSVSEIVKFVKRAQPTVSLQLRVLELSGVLQSEKKGRQVFYRVKEPLVQKILSIMRERR